MEEEYLHKASQIYLILVEQWLGGVSKHQTMCFFLSSLVNELALTARKMYADEAKSSGLVR